MRLQLIVEVDATEEECEQVLDQLAEAVEERELLLLGTGGDAQLVAFNEVPPLGRPKRARP